MGLQHCWHQGPVSWKTVFPRIGQQGREWFGNDSRIIQAHYIYYALLTWQEVQLRRSCEQWGAAITTDSPGVGDTWWVCSSLSFFIMIRKEWKIVLVVTCQILDMSQCSHGTISSVILLGILLAELTTYLFCSIAQQLAINMAKGSKVTTEWSTLVCV